MTQSRTSAVFDCMLFLQALLTEDGPAAECLERFELGQFDLLVSETILDEIRFILSRSDLKNKFARLTAQRVEKLLELLDARADRVSEKSLPKKFSRDPKDEKYLVAAVAGKAKYIVSRDKDLLDLMTDHSDSAKEFRRRYRHINIVDPVEFLKIIRSFDISLKP